MGLGCLNACKHKAHLNRQVRNEDYAVYGGNKAGNRFSRLEQINTENVKNLQLAWTYNTGENNNPGERGAGYTMPAHCG
jgi:quinoprotein glucose dehydrogenase